MRPKLVFFSDIDGTLVDHRLNGKKSFKAIKRIKQRGDFLVLVSSKPAGTIDKISKRIGLISPFVCENGGGIVIPHQQPKLKDFVLKKLTSQRKLRFQEIPEGILIKIGKNRGLVEETLKKAASDFANKFRLPEPFLVFPDMPETKTKIEELGPYFPHWTKEQIKEGTLAKKYFDVAFQFKKNINISKQTKKQFLLEIKKRGLKVKKGGLFYHAFKGCDKGKAIKILNSILKTYTNSPLETIGIGDGENDLEMLLEVNRGFNVQNKEGINLLTGYPKILPVLKIGPEGFSWVINHTYQNLTSD